MPYFSGPNGIREVADAGDRFQQSFNTARRGKLLSDFFTNGQTDLGALARLDPEAAQQIQAQQKQSGLAKMFADLYAAPEDQRPQGIAALLAKDPQMGQQAMKLFDPRFANAGGAAGVQSTYVDDQGRRVAIMRDGSVQVLGGNDMGMSQQAVTVEGPNGEPMQYTFDKRTGTYRSMAGGPTTAQGGVAINYDGPADERAAFDAVVQADQGQPFAPGNYTATNVPPQVRTGVGMGAADKAYAQEQARQRAQLQYEPQIEQAKADVQYGNMGRVGVMDAQNAGLKATEEARAKSAVEQALKVSVRARDDREQLMLLSEAAGLLKKATSGGAAELGRDTARYFGVTTEGAKADAQLETIAGKLTGKVPRFEGPQSNIDVQLYQKMAGDLANAKKTRGERIAAAQGMVNLIKKYQDYAAQQKAPQQPARPGGKLVFNPATGDFD